MADNRTLAEKARATADEHPAGSLPRKAWACVAVCLHTTRTPAGARRALAGIPPVDVRRAAAYILDHLTETANDLSTYYRDMS
jgi:hypothetical protein